MVWNASGADRVKSYRIYQELEAKYDAAVARIQELEKAIAFKDGLIRSLAAEVAMLPKAPTQGDLQHLFEEAADAHARTSTRHDSGMRPAQRPGHYSAVSASNGLRPSSAEGTSEHDDPVPEGDGSGTVIVDPLAHIPSPKAKKQN